MGKLDNKKLDLGGNKNLTMAEICRIRRFMNSASVPPDTPSGFTQLRYITGYADLFERFGMYADKTPLDYSMLTCLLTDDRDSTYTFSATENAADIIGTADDIIEFLMMKRLIKMPKQSVHTISSNATSLDILKDRSQILYDMLEDAGFQKQTSTYIRRVPYKERYSVCAFAPFAHIVLGLKLRTKREDAKRQLHSVYYWGNLSYIGRDGQSLDFSKYFDISDYWYYEMSTGVNL